MSEPSPREFTPDSPFGWYANPPDGTRDTGDAPWEGPVPGSVIRLMSDDSVDVPLWDEEGLIFSDRDGLVREWGVSAGLADDIVAWAGESQRGRSRRLDAEAAALVRRLDAETGRRFTFVYRP